MNTTIFKHKKTADRRAMPKSQKCSTPLIMGACIVMGVAMLVLAAPMASLLLARIEASGWYGLTLETVTTVVRILSITIVVSSVVTLSNYSVWVKYGFWGLLAIVSVAKLIGVGALGFILPSGLIAVWVLAIHVQVLTSRSYLGTIYMRD